MRPKGSELQQSGVREGRRWLTLHRQKDADGTMLLMWDWGERDTVEDDSQTLKASGGVTEQLSIDREKVSVFVAFVPMKDENPSLTL